MQDRDELIALLERTRAEMIDKGVNGWPNAVLLAIEHLQSRPAPTEERVQQFRQHYPTGCWPQPQGDYVGYCGCGVQFSGETRGGAYDAWGRHVADATDTTPSRDARKAIEALLNTSGARGTYDAFEHAAAVKRAEGFLATPSRDEEGSVRKVLEKIMDRHASRVLFHDQALAEEAWAALKTSTPETQTVIEGEQCNCGLPKYGEGDHHEFCLFKPRLPETQTVEGGGRIKHDPDCGLLYEDGPDQCTCKTTPPERARVLEEAAQIMDARAAMYRAKAERHDPLAPDSLTEHERFISNAEASEWGAAAIRALSASPTEVVEWRLGYLRKGE